MKNNLMLGWERAIFKGAIETKLIVLMTGGNRGSSHWEGESRGVTFACKRKAVVRFWETLSGTVLIACGITITLDHLSVYSVFIVVGQESQ